MKRNLFQPIVKTIVMSLTLSLWACTNDTLPELSLDTVSIYTDIDANQNSAIAVDLVIVYDEEVEKTLGKLSAAKYFASSKQLLLDNPTLLDIWHWELVPGQIVQNFEPPQEQGDAYAAYVFANYLTPGDHRLKVAPSGVVKILLQKNDLVNLAKYDVHEFRSGTTMSSETAQRGEDDEEDDEEDTIPQMKLGPTKEVAPPQQIPSPCGAGASKGPGTGEKQFRQEPSVLAPQAKPIPIVTKPLCPPKSVLSPKPTIRKPYRK